VWPRQAARQRVPTEPGKRRDFVAGLLSATDDLADVVQAQQPVDALWPTVSLGLHVVTTDGGTTV
jgi:hypothetical protein